jgi:pantoate--beta-alanine ligase
MKIFSNILDMQNYTLTLKRQGKHIGLVPTMGFLHEGHLSLVHEAAKHADIVVLSIFVNPTQFGPNEDFDKYPRDFERDRKLCEENGVDAIFAPNVTDMYFKDCSTYINENKLSAGLCGSRRPGHFQGVCTVVAKLFNAVLPDVAVFGQKDAQQALVLRRMVRDLNFPVKMLIAPIVRESDGLAMSSRNKYLTEEQRRNALAISSALFKAENKLKAGKKDFNAIAEDISAAVSASGGRIDYVEILDADTLECPNKTSPGLLVAVAAYYGSTRLIDNIIVTADGQE